MRTTWYALSRGVLTCSVMSDAPGGYEWGTKDTIYNMTAGGVYINDFIGLKELNEAGKIKFNSYAGQHVCTHAGILVVVGVLTRMPSPTGAIPSVVLGQLRVAVFQQLARLCGCVGIEVVACHDIRLHVCVCARARACVCVGSFKHVSARYIGVHAPSPFR